MSHRGAFGLAAAIVLAACNSCTSIAPAPAQRTPERPRILPNHRQDEEWSVLADPRVEREPLDRLKYMPLSPNHPKTFLSLGVNLRERFEVDHAPFFGAVSGAGGEWLLSRVEVHGDLRLEDHFQLFTQFENAIAPGKHVRGPVDQDRLDVEQAFIGLTEPLGGGTLKLRLGRQLLAIDLQRYVSVRDGPNVRQPYDAAYADYQRGAWHVTSAYTQPVHTRDLRLVDDFSNRRLTFSGVMIRRRVLGSGQLAVVYSHYTHDAAAFASVTGNERRDSVDVRLTGAAKGFDWDIEAMKQTGRIATQTIEAAGFGSLIGYTLTNVGWSPRIGLGVDAATGDRNPHDNTLGTFNPLFPNGYYLADYTGYPNLIHLKPAVTVHPAHGLNVMFAVASQWRQTTADAVYLFPSVPLAGTAGTPGRYTGTYGELRGDWTITRHESVAFDAVHYAIGTSIRQAGGHDADYLGLEFRYGW